MKECLGTKNTSIINTMEKAWKKFVKDELRELLKKIPKSWSSATYWYINFHTQSNIKGFSSTPSKCCRGETTIAKKQTGSRTEPQLTLKATRKLWSLVKVWGVDGPIIEISTLSGRQDAPRTSKIERTVGSRGLPLVGPSLRPFVSNAMNQGVEDVCSQLIWTRKD